VTQSHPAPTPLSHSEGLSSGFELPPLAAYIHIPWCVKKCPYCDFNSHAAGPTLPEEEYVDALLADLDADLAQVHQRPLSSIFFGGGTPSLFSAKALGRLLEGVERRVPFAADIEITLEANPGTFEQAKFRDYRSLGINRLSIGVQSFQPAKLKALGRIHDGDEAVRAADMARAAGFDNFNLDLMHGLPGQTLLGAETDLLTAIACEPSHLSWYQLTIEPNTVFHKRPPQLPVEDELADGGFLLGAQAGQPHGDAGLAHICLGFSYRIFTEVKDRGRQNCSGVPVAYTFDEVVKSSNASGCYQRHVDR
jgi:oxygen-independent coproporphyrinogen-3 oxidase